MLFWIFAALAVYYVHVFLPSLIRIPQIGVNRYVGSRDDLPDLPVVGRRAQRALRNLSENMLPFSVLAVLNIVLGTETNAILGAQLFVGARLVYLFTYLFAIPWLRSAVWSVGFIGLVLMAIPLLANG